jgi:hypothetical protein
MTRRMMPRRSAKGAELVRRAPRTACRPSPRPLTIPTAPEPILERRPRLPGELCTDAARIGARSPQVARDRRLLANFEAVACRAFEVRYHLRIDASAAPPKLYVPPPRSIAAIVASTTSET